MHVPWFVLSLPSFLMLVDVLICLYVISALYIVLPCKLYQIALVLLNARMSAKSFNIWSGPLLLPLASLMLSKFSLISPLVSFYLSSLDSVAFSVTLRLTLFLCYRALCRLSVFSFCKLLHLSLTSPVTWNMVCKVIQTSEFIGCLCECSINSFLCFFPWISMVTLIW